MLPWAQQLIVWLTIPPVGCNWMPTNQLVASVRNINYVMNPLSFWILIGNYVQIIWKLFVTIDKSCICVKVTSFSKSWYTLFIFIENIFPRIHDETLSYFWPKSAINVSWLFLIFIWKQKLWSWLRKCFLFFKISEFLHLRAE